MGNLGSYEKLTTAAKEAGGPAIYLGKIVAASFIAGMGSAVIPWVACKIKQQTDSIKETRKPQMKSKDTNLCDLDKLWSSYKQKVAENYSSVVYERLVDYVELVSVDNSVVTILVQAETHKKMWERMARKLFDEASFETFGEKLKVKVKVYGEDLKDLRLYR